MFLQDLRKSVKPIVWVVAIGFVASLFFTYGRLTSRQSGEKPLLRVNGEEISYLDFLQAYRSAYERLIQNTGGEISPEMETYLKSQILSQLLNNRLLYQEAKKAGIKVSDVEIENQISRIMKSFGSRENFMRYLQYNRIKYPEFEEEIRRQIAISRLTQLIRESIVVTEEEVKNYWIMENEKLDLAYLFLDPEKYASDIKVDIDEAKKFYEKNKEEFKVPEKVKLQYILISPQEFKDEVQITEQELKKYYEENPGEFQVEEKRRASHILVKVSSDAKDKDIKEARDKIEKIKEQLDKGADFAKLASKYSDDKTTAEKGGDLGFFTYGTMTPEFSKAVFSLKKVGDISDVVQTPYGFHIIKLTGIEPAYKKSFEEIKEKLRETMIQSRCEELAREEIKKVKERIETGQITFEDYAKEYPERVRFPSPFALYEKVEDLSWEPQFNRVAFSLEPGKVSSILRISEGYVIMMAKGKIPSYIPDWDEVKEKVMDKVAREKAIKITAQRAESIVKEVKEGKKLSSYEKEWEYQVLNSLTRDEWIKGISGEDRQKFLKVAFSLPEGEISEAIPLSEGYYIIKVFKREIPLEKFSQEKNEFREELINRKREEVLSSWFKNIREKAKVIDNTALFLTPSS